MKIVYFSHIPEHHEEIINTLYSEWNKINMLTEFELPTHALIHENMLLGTYNFIEHDNALYLNNIYIFEQYRYNGAGRYIIEDCIENYRIHRFTSLNIYCQSNLEKYFEEFGFETIHKEQKENKIICFMAQ